MKKTISVLTTLFLMATPAVARKTEKQRKNDIENINHYCFETTISGYDVLELCSAPDSATEFRACGQEVRLAIRKIKARCGFRGPINCKKEAVYWMSHQYQISIPLHNIMLDTCKH